MSYTCQPERSPAAQLGTFITIETWRAQADLDAHMGTPHVRIALGAAGEALAGLPVIHPLIPLAS